MCHIRVSSELELLYYERVICKNSYGQGLVMRRWTGGYFDIHSTNSEFGGVNAPTVRLL